MNCAASTTMCKLPNSHAESKKEGPWGPVSHPDSDTRDQVLMNLLQTGGIKSKCAPLASVASMERRRRYCSCSELSFHSSKNALLCTNGNREPSNSSCNCNMENCAWVPSHPCSEEAFSSSFKSQSWRSSSDQSTTNAALHRALAAMKKVSGEPDAVKKSQHKSRGMNDRGNILPVPCEIETNGRSITNSDARTLSMRERGRWGNSKMQQQLFGGTPATHPSCTTGGQNVKPNVSSDNHHNHQALQHVQCLHCGSFSTTPVSSAAKGTRSHSFGRRVRDYSWQQELQQEHKRPEQHAKEGIGGRPLSQSGRPGAQNGNVHHQCEYARCADELPEYEAGVAGMKLQHQGGTMSWQDRYMLLCQAIAAGAFVDGAPDDSSGQLMPSSRGYSWAVCECTACEMGGERSFRRAAASANYCSTSSGERMMELEAFSGPLGYVSESKGTELNGLMEKRAARRGISRWWARLPSFGRAKSNSTAQGGGQKNAWAAGQNTAQCSACGQRVWARGEEELGARLCPDCLGRAGGATCEAGTIPPPAARPTPPSAARSRSFQPPPFSNFTSHHHKSLPRRWRLMKLCRYLMGFPLQR